MNVKRYMSRKITVERGDSIEEYPLSIATVTYATDGTVLDVVVQPYEREIPNVEYLDTPLHFVIPASRQ
jgi:hypothetical protein